MRLFLKDNLANPLLFFIEGPAFVPNAAQAAVYRGLIEGREVLADDPDFRGVEGENQFGGVN